MGEIGASYTYHTEQGRRVYRGAVRRLRDAGVIWECEHEHEQTREARMCGQREWRLRFDATRPAERAGGG